MSTARLSFERLMAEHRRQVQMIPVGVGAVTFRDLRMATTKPAFNYLKDVFNRGLKSAKCPLSFPAGCLGHEKSSDFATTHLIGVNLAAALVYIALTRSKYEDGWTVLVLVVLGITSMRLQKIHEAQVGGLKTQLAEKTEVVEALQNDIAAGIATDSDIQDLVCEIAELRAQNASLLEHAKLGEMLDDHLQQMDAERTAIQGQVTDYSRMLGVRDATIERLVEEKMKLLKLNRDSHDFLARSQAQLNDAHVYIHGADRSRYDMTAHISIVEYEHAKDVRELYAIVDSKNEALEAANDTLEQVIAERDAAVDAAAIADEKLREYDSALHTALDRASQISDELDTVQVALGASFTLIAPTSEPRDPWAEMFRLLLNCWHQTQEVDFVTFGMCCRLAAHEKRERSLQEDLCVKEKDVEEQKQENEALKRQITEMLAHMAKLNKQSGHLQISTRNLKTRAIAAMGKVHALTAKNEDDQNKARVAVKEEEEHVQRLKEHICSMHQVISAGNAKVTQQRAEIAVLKEEIKNLSEENEWDRVDDAGEEEDAVRRLIEGDGIAGEKDDILSGESDDRERMGHEAVGQQTERSDSSWDVEHIEDKAALESASESAEWDMDRFEDPAIQW
ncbi:hypothetical protein LTR66_002612 [Elasticomyces elasticus]|nr:hypothetical protein LTR66_002612 [Elasticomyces elasticus]